MARLLSNSMVTSNAAPPSSHPWASILMPSSMKLKPSPRIMPMATGRLTRSATFFAAPVMPSRNQITPVTMPAPYTALGVIVIVCAA
ncbi:hypothetical protein D3C83_14490 [compost metagenome]